MSMMDLFDMDELQLGLWMPESYETKIGGGDIFETGFNDGVQDEFTKTGLPASDALENLLFPEQLDPLPLEDEWMERLDMTSFIDLDKKTILKVPEYDIPKTGKKLQEVKPVVQDSHPKPGRLRLLQELLLQGVPQKTAPTSPEAQVAPDICIDVLESLPEPDNKSMVLGDSEITPEISFDLFGDDPLTHLTVPGTGFVNSWNREGTISSASSASGYSLDNSFESSSQDTANASTQSSEYIDSALGQPLSPDDLESVFSGSAPSSPSSDDPDYLPTSTDTTSKKSRKSRHTPYSKDGSGCLNRKDKKKLQNKNAAIRYRMKKKAECDSIKKEEDALAKRNDELRDKVEQITREIKYMKDLMAEVYKAKRVKIENQRGH